MENNPFYSIMLSIPEDQRKSSMEVSFPVGKAPERKKMWGNNSIDTRTFQRYDVNNPTVQQQIGSSSVGVLMPNNPYRTEAEGQVLKNVAEALTDPTMTMTKGITPTMEAYGFKSVKNPKNTQLWRMDSDIAGSPKVAEFTPSTGGWSNDPYHPEGRYFSESKGGIIQGVSSPYENPIKKGVKETIPKEFDALGIDWDKAKFDYSVGRPAEGSTMIEIDEKDLQNFIEKNGLVNSRGNASKAMVTDFLRDKADFLRIKNFEGNPGYNEIIQINPNKAKIRGRDTLYSTAPVGLLVYEMMQGDSNAEIELERRLHATQKGEK